MQKRRGCVLAHDATAAIGGSGVSGPASNFLRPAAAAATYRMIRFWLPWTPRHPDVKWGLNGALVVPLGHDSLPASDIFGFMLPWI